MSFKAIKEPGPNYFKDQFPFDEIPKIKFNNAQHHALDIPDDIWITDTTFRDGQQSLRPMSVEEITTLFDYLHKLDNDSGIIRQTEFFLYTDKDKAALKQCMDRGYRYPEITSWIRANKSDLELVKELGIKETGMLMSISDYHIFHKLGMSRQEAMNHYLDLAEETLKNGIIPRCHLEDVTRADFPEFVVPLASNLMELSEKYGMQVKIRACDTLGIGVPFSYAELPRSVPAIVKCLREECGVPAESIEWHGHNDFNKGVVNATACWLYGGASANSTLMGIGERTGNSPLESMIFEYAQIKGNTKTMNLKMISEIAKYFENEIGLTISPKAPFIGSEFNLTKAGIHADGLLKHREIYNSFDTEKILDKIPLVSINSYSGLAGIATWINSYYKLPAESRLGKADSKIVPLKAWIDKEYEGGRTTCIKNRELRALVEKHLPDILLLSAREHKKTICS